MDGILTILCRTGLLCGPLYVSQGLFGGSISTIKMSRSTCSHLEVSALLGLLQCWCVFRHQWWNTQYIYPLYVHQFFIWGILFLSHSEPCCRIGEQKIHEVKLMVIAQVSQGVHLEVHSRRIWGPQGPDPPTFPYLAETWVVAVHFIYCCNGHINKCVLRH